MIFEEAMKAMREGKTVAREDFKGSTCWSNHFLIGKIFGEESVVNELGDQGYIYPWELLRDDWVVIEKKEKRHGK